MKISGFSCPGRLALTYPITEGILDGEPFKTSCIFKINVY